VFLSTKFISIGNLLLFLAFRFGGQARLVIDKMSFLALRIGGRA